MPFHDCQAGIVFQAVRIVLPVMLFKPNIIGVVDNPYGASMSRSEMPYDIQFTDTAAKSLRRYPKKDQQRILSRIERLAADPLSTTNVRRLIDFDVTYRLRVGNYRVLFERDDIIRVIDVIDVLSRGRAYRRK